MNHESRINPQIAGDDAEASMVCSIRLLLSTSVLLALYIDPDSMGRLTRYTWMVLFAYTLHSAVLCCFAHVNATRPQSMAIYWLDVLWYAVIVFFTNGNNNIFFLFFFFAILAASFRWGFDAGARITLASVLLFAISALLATNQSEHSRLLLRSTFLLGLGYMIAYWGGSAVTQKRHLALLRDVSQLSNPRFGVDQTIASVLEKTRVFFNAHSCILLTRDAESATWSLRTAMDQDAGLSIDGACISADTASPLLAFAPDHLVLYTRPLWRRLPWSGRSSVLDHTESRWTRRHDDAGENLADMLEARSFISAPLPFRNGSGRIFVASSARFSKIDALFLSHIGAQAFPVIENIELLDRFASQAALREREKMALDLHDTALQPYIGLRHCLSAVRNKAAPDNALIDDLNKLISMTTQVIDDLRHFAKNIKQGIVHGEPELLAALRRQTAQIKEFYAIEIELCVDGKLDISDRLAAEVFQIVNEGMSNIRKHSKAQRGLIHISCANGSLAIRIDNDSNALPAPAFIPQSIMRRASALGGRARVLQAGNGITSVNIEIPI